MSPTLDLVWGMNEDSATTPFPVAIIAADEKNRRKKKTGETCNTDQSDFADHRRVVDVAIRGGIHHALASLRTAARGTEDLGVRANVLARS